MNLSIYFKNSAHRFYGAITALVMLSFYEIFIVWDSTSGMIVRNAPEAWLRGLLNILGISHYHISFLMITVSLVAIPMFHDSGVVLKKKIALFMIIEAILWGAVSGIIIQLLIANLFFYTGAISGSIVRDLGLAIGAGLFEELFFRVILTTLLIKIGYKTIRVKWLSIFVAIVLASFLFSLAHYVGNAGDNFEVYSFLFRFIAGLWFTTLYSVRGFAIVCMTHAFYDIFIILL